jgi:predicted  nucleic acid-binding Zn-ribbon protein
VQSDLKRLLALQDVDRIVISVEEELRALEPEIAELDAVVARLDEEAVGLEAKLEEARAKRSELESHIETYRVMQERRRQKLEWVRGAKEASALMAEIDLARSVLAQEEAEWIRSADEVQGIEALAAESAERMAAAREEQAPRREEIAAVRAERTGRLEEAQGRREEAADEIRKSKRSLLAMYDRIRSGRAPYAMYELHADACGHCYTSVPMHRRQQIQRGESLATCEACGVLIYIPE